MSLPAPLQGFLRNVGQSWKAKGHDASQLVRVIKFETDSYDEVQISLGQYDHQADLSQTVSKATSIPTSERTVAFLCSLLEYIRSHPKAALLASARGSNDIPLDVVRSAYDAWSDVYSKASLVFQAQEQPFFGPTLRYIGTILVLLAIAADDAAKDPSQHCVTDAVSKISRTTGVAAIDRSPLPGEKTKRADVLWLANASFRCYFKLKNVRLCETVLGSVENALTLNRNFASEEQKAAADDDDLGTKCYSLADRVTYKYYLGRLRLSQHRIRKAYTELRWAFDHCTNAHIHNKRILLTHLVVASLILGIYPARSLLQSASLDGPFGDLVENLRSGNGQQVLIELDNWRDWHRQRGNYLLLKEKLPISVWRNLMRRSFLIARLSSGIGAPSSLTAQAGGQPVRTPPPTLKLHNFLTCARKAWGDSTLELDDVECVTASLIDQGYIKAYAMHSTGNVVFRRTPDFGFEKISCVY